MLFEAEKSFQTKINGLKYNLSLQVSLLLCDCGVGWVSDKQHLNYYNFFFFFFRKSQGVAWEC